MQGHLTPVPRRARTSTAELFCRVFRIHKQLNRYRAPRVRISTCSTARVAKPVDAPRLDVIAEAIITWRESVSCHPEECRIRRTRIQSCAKSSLEMRVLWKPGTLRRRVCRSRQVRPRWKVQAQCI